MLNVSQNYILTFSRLRLLVSEFRIMAYRNKSYVLFFNFFKGSSSVLKTMT